MMHFRHNMCHWDSCRVLALFDYMRHRGTKALPGRAPLRKHVLFNRPYRTIYDRCNELMRKYTQFIETRDTENLWKAFNLGDSCHNSQQIAWFLEKVTEEEGPLKTCEIVFNLNRVGRPLQDLFCIGTFEVADLLATIVHSFRKRLHR